MDGAVLSEVGSEAESVFFWVGRVEAWTYFADALETQTLGVTVRRSNCANALLWRHEESGPL